MQNKTQHNKVQKSIYCSAEISIWKTWIGKGKDIHAICILISMISQLLKTLYK